MSRCSSSTTNPVCARRMHEGADLRSYVGGCVRSGTANQKHKATCLARAFSDLTDMRSEKHSHLAYCSWLTSKNDVFSRILDGTHEIWCTHIRKHENPPSISLFLVPRAVCRTEFSHTLKLSEAHAGLPRHGNTNLGALASETM
jgi:hypothetical protein